MAKGTCAITGATGFLGGYLVNKMKESGWKVKKLQRTNNDSAKTENDIIYFSLGEKPKPESLIGIDVLIHCAYDFSCTKWEQINEVNVTGTRLLFEAAKAANVSRIVFISSIHAFEGCKAMYGRAKLASEKDAFNCGAVVLRPDTIYGEKDGELFGGQGGNSLQLFDKIFRATPVVPIPYSKKPTVYTSHIEDFSNLIEEVIASNEVPAKPLCAVNHNPLTLKQFFSIIKDRSSRKFFLFIPVPWKILWFLLLFLESINIRLSFRSESILIFFDQNPAPDFSAIDCFKTKIRPF